MIITADTLTLSFLVVASVTLAVVVVLIWYVYTTKKFREEIIKLMDDKLQVYLDNLETSEKEEEPTAEVADPQEGEEEKPQSFVEVPQEEQKEVAEELPKVQNE